ncbi:hypothetical protein M3765_13155 [Streptomyces thermoviolaceus]|jgi:hypothetical protein|uniref:Integral membrane protein n=1 Tax=Streptomyces thermoviolaceus subsp. thermoviolaceus TaxID=66860 RepID=A0ABX0YVW4_STRTL|nr:MULTISPECIES: hypothetical protein [Streptomyces]MCM3264960.1 hypothetical protein [Streptomyces thermoviolaceus]NJP15233.1 hypothetical protein [Streptomyces thermoviolaceus subsp. thermoviolaceus]RSR99808.1 hypothetical protein EF917_18565 [Streptomyces sp. WAC00469]WTD46046.1 hypothetical protein OG899_00055 [Streptomyces thermoviolaceus]GGV76734.1 hypothetical protein GCM10010499_34990 [Streptomyces thermoviolaceus subsp. apingens]
MPPISSQSAVERAAAAVVSLAGAVSAVLLLAEGTQATGTPAWLLPVLAVLGAVVPSFTVLVLCKTSHRAALVAFGAAAACHAAALGASGGDLSLKILLGLSVGVSFLVCVRVTVLRAEASENRPRNRF